VIEITSLFYSILRSRENQPVRDDLRKTLLRSLAPLALMALIFYLSGQEVHDPDFPWWEVTARKLGHMTGYAALTVLWAWALTGTVRRPLAWAAAISVLYACSDEFHQSFTETRHGTPVDVLIDSIGVLVATVGWKRWAGSRQRA
jgi:hypothetical protein